MSERYNIYIGCGGMGVSTIGKIERYMSESDKRNSIFAAVDFKDTAEMNALSDNVKRMFSLSVPDLDSYIDKEIKKHEDFSTWWIESYKPDGISDKTAGGQIRINGRLAFYRNISKFENLFNNIQDDIRNITGGIGGIEQHYHIISSLGGGTGAGLVIDLISYIRFYLQNKLDRVWGYFYDPTIMDSTIHGRAPEMAMGALIEMNHWLINPQEYKIKYPEINIPIDLKNKDIWLDGLFLIQKSTKHNKYFVSHGSNTAREQYINLVANTLACKKALTDFFENDGREIIKFNSHLGKSTKFLGLGYSHIRVPINEISKYFEANILSKHFLQSNDDLKLNPEEAISDIQFSRLEHDFKTNDGWNNIFNQKNELISGCTNKIDLERSIKLDDNLFNRFEKNAADKLKIIVSEFKNNIDTKITNNLFTIRFKDIEKWLVSIDDQITKNLSENRKIFNHDKVEKTPEVQINDKKEIIIRTIRSIKKDTNIIGKPTGSFKRALNDVICDFKPFFDFRVAYSISAVAQPFYRDIKSYLEECLSKVRKFKEAYETVLSQYEKMLSTAEEKIIIDRYDEHKPIFDISLLEKNAYTLELKIGVSKKYLNEKYKEVFETLIAGTKQNVSNYIKDGDEGDALIPSIDNFYSVSSTQKDIEKYLSRIISKKVVPFITEETESKITINDAFNGYLQIVHNDFLDMNKGKVTQNELKKKYIVDFGGFQQYEGLFNKDLISDKEDRWISLAQELLINRFLYLVEPFWNPDTIEREDFLEDVEKLKHIKNLKKYMMLPIDFDLNNLNYYDTKPNIHFFERKKDRIAFLYCDLGCPIYAFKNLVPIFIDYYNQSFKSKGSNFPYHTDKRFLDGPWKPEENFFEKPHDEKYFLRLYLLSLGFGVIVRDNKGWYRTPATKIQTTWPKFIEKYREDQNIQDEVSQLVYDEANKHYAVEKRIDDIFIKGITIHSNIHQVAEHKNIFNKFTKELGIVLNKNINGEIFISKYGVIPSSQKEIENLLSELKSS